MTQIETLRELTHELERRATYEPAGVFETDSPDSRLAHGDGGNSMREQAKENEQLIETLTMLLTENRQDEAEDLIKLELPTAITKSENLL